MGNVKAFKSCKQAPHAEALSEGIAALVAGTGAQQAPNKTFDQKDSSTTGKVFGQKLNWHQGCHRQAQQHFWHCDWLQAGSSEHDAQAQQHHL